ncbi:hypothetical protein OAO01_09500 [Oligoflexia bacterium]|nr:hypothetical protein [Oligoflexia bacterium]
MAKAPKNSSTTTQEEAFEIIELASDDLNVLTRAFDVIAEVCEELNHPYLNVGDDDVPDTLLN